MRRPILFISPGYVVSNAVTTSLNDIKDMPPKTTVLLGLCGAAFGLNLIKRFLPKRSYKYLLLKPSMRKPYKGRAVS